MLLMEPSWFKFIKIKPLAVEAINLPFQIMQFTFNQKIKILLPLSHTLLLTIPKALSPFKNVSHFYQDNHLHLHFYYSLLLSLTMVHKTYNLTWINRFSIEHPGYWALLMSLTITLMHKSKVPGHQLRMGLFLPYPSLSLQAIQPKLCNQCGFVHFKGHLLSI
jgi:hypothetical protein